MSRRDFIKSLAIATKELSECRYWLMLDVRMGWVKDTRVEELLSECDELSRILHAMIRRSREKPA